MPTAGTLPSRIPPQARQRLATPISAAQSSALRTMSTAGLLRPTLDAVTVDSLIQAGYVREGSGGLMVSDEGNFRSTMENVS